MPTDDPGELFDLCDAHGRPLGLSKPRSFVHRDGDWHRSVHVWVILAGDRVVLQRRSLAKDSHAGMVDVSVAGHVSHAVGTAPEDAARAALREMEEEIGLVLPSDALISLGVRRQVDATPERLDREVQEVFYVVTSCNLDTLRPDPDEVLGLLEVSLSGARALCEGGSSVGAREIRPRDPCVHDAVLRREELVPGRDVYFATALRSIEHRLGGGHEPAWTVD